jgi:hypothetical protein
MTPRPIALACAAAFLAAAQTAGAQQSYRCLDPAGRTAYTERPCESMGLRTERTLKDPPKAAAAPTARPAAVAAAAPAPRPTRTPAAGADTRRVMCGDVSVTCERGTLLTCGSQQVRCEGD